MGEEKKIFQVVIVREWHNEKLDQWEIMTPIVLDVVADDPKQAFGMASVYAKGTANTGERYSVYHSAPVMMDADTLISELIKYASGESS